MARSGLDYGGMMHRAMQGLIAEVLRQVARDGLPGEHHFFITFDTRDDGVEMADWLRERYRGDDHRHPALVRQPDGRGPITSPSR